MPQMLTTIPLVIPGVSGINRQEAGGVLGAEWAYDAKNCVIDKNGRLTSRKGWSALSDAIAASPDVTAIYEYLDTSGTSRIISATAAKLYEGSSGALTDRTGALTPSAGHWKFQNFNGYVVGWQAGHNPIVKSGTGNFSNITAASGTLPQGNTVLAAYGRLWAPDADGLTLRWCDLLDYTNWGTGTAGTLNLRQVWTDGMDYCVALAAFNGYLIIFGRDTILVYSGATSPVSMALVEVIRGVGCIARDSVMTMGVDTWFLSRKGIFSLGRVVQEDSMPVFDISKNVRDFMMDYVNEEDVDDIKAVYDPVNAFYLLSLPTSNVTFCFDIRFLLEDGSARATYWTLTPTAMYLATDKVLYFGMPGYLAKYNSYADNGTAYRLAWLSPWIEMSPDEPVVKILKQLVSILNSQAAQTVTYKWAFDFSGTFFSVQRTYAADTSAEYGVGEYGSSEYGGAASLRLSTLATAGQGRLIRVGVETDVNGAAVSIQRLDLQAKTGRLA